MHNTTRAGDLPPTHTHKRAGPTYRKADLTSGKLALPFIMLALIILFGGEATRVEDRHEGPGN